MFCTKSGYDKFPESFFLNQILYIDIAGAKSEALDNIYSLFKRNIKSCNAKRLFLYISLPLPSLLKKWHTSVIIQEISFSNLEKGRFLQNFPGELTALRMLLTQMCIKPF